MRFPVFVFAALATGVALSACRTPLVSTPGPITPSPGNVGAVPAYQSTISAATFGSVELVGQVRNGGYNEVASSPGPDQPVSRGASASGNEEQISCGTEANNSNSSASAAFTPQSDSVRRVYGFALQAGARSDDGFWRGKSTVFCKGSNHERAMARAKVQGRVDLTFAANPALTDKIVVRVSGEAASETRIQVQTVDGQARNCSGGRGF
jgi:hypothetical protein